MALAPVKDNVQEDIAQFLGPQETPAQEAQTPGGDPPASDAAAGAAAPSTQAAGTDAGTQQAATAEALPVGAATAQQANVDGGAPSTAQVVAVDAGGQPDYKAMYEASLAEVERINTTLLAQQLGQPPANQQQAPPAAQQQSQQVTQQQAPAGQQQEAPIEFIPDADFDKVMGDPKKFNAILNTLRRDAIREAAGVAYQAAVQRTYQEMPTIVAGIVTNQLATRTVSDKFFEQNNDMKTVPPSTFQSEYLTVSRELEGKPLVEILNKTRDNLRSRLHLPIPAASAAAAVTNSSLPGGDTQRVGQVVAPKLEGVQADIANVLKGRI